MSEKLTENNPTQHYRDQVYDYFYEKEDQRRVEYEKRGITPVNNLKLYFDPNPMPPYDTYYQPAICGVIDELRGKHPELWEKVLDLKEAYREAELDYLTKEMYGDPRAGAQKSLKIELKWQYEAALSEAFDALAPLLEAAGIEPVDACK